MWLNTQISYSNHHIERFDIIAAMAKTMKSCHLYMVSAEEGLLYGCPEEPYCLHVLPIPPQYVPSVSFSFRMDTLDSDILEEYKNFVMFDSFPWALIPRDNVPQSDNYIQCRIDNKWVIVDKSTGTTVDHLDLFSPDTPKAVFMPSIGKLVYNKNSISSRLSTPILFEGIEDNPAVSDVRTSRTSIGRRYIELVAPNGTKYQMFVFKNLFNLNKNDKLDVAIRDRLDNTNIFEAEFFVRRKKNNIKYIFDPYVEHIYTQFIHM